ncbi:MAG: B12-binding domain-containing radical SAM protein [Cyanobacteria bacterium HKST-UBA04]|nr:B12-binding domain-containing radical SAM protein [Cyanobacteria bacterium HKST-UBA04]
MQGRGKHTGSQTGNPTAHVCLIRPPAAEKFRLSSTSVTLPLGLAYIAGALEGQGHQVSVIDAVGLAPTHHTRYYTGYLVGLSFEAIVDRIDPACTCIGISVIFTHEWPMAVKLIEAIRRRFPATPIILGGEHVTALPEFCLATSQASVVVAGEGEETVIELVETLSRHTSLEGILGIAYRQGEAIHVNPRRPRQTNIDAVARPAWHHFDLHAYHRHRFVGGMVTDRLTIPILATRGCPYQCTYCSSPNMWTPKWVPRTPEAVVDEIETYVKQYGARNFPFQDLTAILDRDWILRFCKALQDRNLDITWLLPTGTRAEAIDETVAQALKDTGMVSMAYAPESGSETTRKLVKKRMHTQALFDSIQAALAQDLNVALFMVIGFPHDTPQHLDETMAFLEDVARIGAEDVAIAYYMAMPGTQLFGSLYDSGQIRMDRTYFNHLFANSDLIPVSSYAPHLSRWQLFWAKCRFYLKFYCFSPHAKRSRSGLAFLRQAIGSFFSRNGHQSRMQSALTAGVRSGWHTLVVQFTPPWIPRAEEDALFADWDRLYRDIRQNRQQQRPALHYPANTTLLHKQAVQHMLGHEHAGLDKPMVLSLR